MVEFDFGKLEDPMMPFGKYGPDGEMGHTKLSEVPDDYLVWLLEKAEGDDLRPKWLNRYVREEWERRKGYR